MIRAAIVGIGRWGRTLVTSIQGKSTAIRFVAGHTRTRSSAESFCAEHGIRLEDAIDGFSAIRQSMLSSSRRRTVSTARKSSKPRRPASTSLSKSRLRST